MTAKKPTVLTHPDSDQTVEVDDAHAEVFLTQGWVESKPKSDK